MAKDHPRIRARSTREEVQMTSGSAEDRWARLSRAQRTVVDLACEGLTNPEIAERLSLSPRTVQRHLYEVFRKMGVATRSELVAAAVRRKVVGEMSESSVDEAE